MSYNDLTKQLLDKIFKGLEESAPEPMSITLHTGWLGFWAFEWAMIGFQGYIKYPYWVDTHSRINKITIHLLRREGLVKATSKLVDGKHQIIVKVGTIVQLTTTDFKDVNKFLDNYVQQSGNSNK